MSRDNQFQALVDQAVAQGILPAGAQAPMAEPRPWPVLLLTALGAWLAALPLIAVIGLLFGDALSRGAGLYLVGAMVLAGAVVILRSASVPLFVEQMAVPAVIVGGAALGLASARDLGEAWGAVLLGLVALGIGMVLPRASLRVLLGGAAALCFGSAWSLAPWSAGGLPEGVRLWAGCHAILGAWVVASVAQAWGLRQAGGVALAAIGEPVAAGWLAATLLMLAMSSGMTFLVGGVIPGAGAGGGLAWSSRAEAAMQGVSAALAIAACLRLSAAWPAIPRAALWGAAAIAAALAALMPALGGVLLALALCAVRARWRLAAAAGLAAAWTVGAFYYQLDLPLSAKALFLVAAGGGLAAVGSMLHRRAALVDERLREPHAASPSPSRRVRATLALSAITALAVVNAGIWQKERLIAEGRAVFLELAPVDPRSLVQGDYMALNVSIPEDVSRRLAQLPRAGAQRPRLVARNDAQGVARLLRLDDGRPLAAAEFLIEMTPKDGRWIVVTDAWHFREGEAARWAEARYGEFRVDAHGRALLVGLRNESLQQP